MKNTSALVMFARVKRALLFVGACAVVGSLRLHDAHAEILIFQKDHGGDGGYDDSGYDGSGYDGSGYDGSGYDGSSYDDGAGTRDDPTDVVIMDSNDSLNSADFESGDIEVIEFSDEEVEMIEGDLHAFDISPSAILGLSPEGPQIVAITPTTPEEDAADREYQEEMERERRLIEAWLERNDELRHHEPHEAE